MSHSKGWVVCVFCLLFHVWVLQHVYVQAMCEQLGVVLIKVSSVNKGERPQVQCRSVRPGAIFVFKLQAQSLHHLVKDDV